MMFEDEDELQEPAAPVAVEEPEDVELSFDVVLLMEALVFLARSMWLLALISASLNLW